MAETTPNAARPRPWLKWALVASLGLNLAVAGVVAGAVLKRPLFGPPPLPGLWQYAHALPEPYRNNLSHALRDSRRDWIGQREALGGQREALAAALVAAPYDLKQVEAVLGREPQLSDELAARGARLLLDQIARMDPADRAAYADALRHARRGR